MGVRKEGERGREAWLGHTACGATAAWSGTGTRHGRSATQRPGGLHTCVWQSSAGPRARRNWCSAATGATQNASNHSKPNDETNDKNAAAAVASLVAKDEGIPMTKQTIRTGVLMRVPNVSPADDIITSGLKRASRRAVFES